MSAIGLSASPNLSATAGSRSPATAMGDSEAGGSFAGVLGETQSPREATSVESRQRVVEAGPEEAGGAVQDAGTGQTDAESEAEADAAQVAALLGLVPAALPAEMASSAGGAGGLAAMLTARPQPTGAPEAFELALEETLTGLSGGLSESRFQPEASALSPGSLLSFEGLTVGPGHGAGEGATQAGSPSGAGGPGFADALSSLRGTSQSGGAVPHGGGTLRSPLGSAPWGEELGGRLTLMLDRGEQFASLQLSPEDFGPLEIRIALREGEATVWFGSQAPEARAAIEQALPRLRELFAAGGLSLADAGVFSGSPQDPHRTLTAASLARASRESGDEAGPPASVVPLRRRGLLDLYA